MTIAAMYIEFPYCCRNGWAVNTCTKPSRVHSLGSSVGGWRKISFAGLKDEKNIHRVGYRNGTDTTTSRT